MKQDRPADDNHRRFYEFSESRTKFGSEILVGDQETNVDRGEQHSDHAKPLRQNQCGK